MKKSERISDYVAALPGSEAGGWHPCYRGYFTCFNAGDYYEAHDVLEHLWLRCSDEHALFYKGLIQVAGAFVHLRKQFLRPEHPKDGRRLRPAVRLFRLALTNLEPYGPRHLGLDVAALAGLCRGLAEGIERGGFVENPWAPLHAPRLELAPAA